jgi:hypothetical protein
VRLAHHVVAVDGGVALVGLDQGGEDADRCRLARPVRAEQAEHRSGLDLQRDPVERPGFPEVLDQAFCDY